MEGHLSKHANHQAFAKLWDAAEGVLADADVIVFVGYRIPHTDAIARERILRAIASDQRQSRRVHIVLGPDVEAGGRLTALINFTGPGQLVHQAKPFPILTHPLYAEDAEDFFGVVHRAGNVSGKTGGQVAGMFLSHVLQNAGTPSFTSARDSTSQGNLRTDYEYLGAAETPPPATVAVGLVNPLLGCVACAAIWRNDWASDPVDFEPAPGIFRQISFPGRILPFGNARFAMLGDVLNPVY